LNWHSIKAWWFDPATKRLGYAVFISIFIHFLLIEQSDWVAFSKTSSSFRYLDAELVANSPPTPSQAITEVVQDVDTSPETAVKPEIVEPAPSDSEIVDPDAVSPSEEVNSEEVPSEANSASNNSHAAETQTEAATAVAEAVTETQPGLVLPDTAETVAKPQPFTTVETDFDVLMNRNPERVGTAKIYYSKGTGQRYELTWKVSATGFIGLLYPDLLQTSQGKIMEFGLMPDFYLYKFGEREDKSYQASFYWADKEVALQSTKGTKRVALDSEASAGHIQDFLSFMYQFMFAPPLDEMQMYLTNGRKLGLYTYAFEGEETLELKFANVNTYHIQHAKTDSDEKTELWLAKDYRYVPVKIRKTEKDGTVIEQIATRLKFETLENETPLP
jgi:hypothetical protein